MRYWISGALVAVLVWGCGKDDNNPNRNNIIPTNNSNNNSNNSSNNNSNNNSNNTNNTNNNNNTNGYNCTDVVCPEPDQQCVRDMCISDYFKIACNEPNELGVLDTSTPFTTSGDTADFADSLRVGCANMDSTFSGPENAFEFTVDSLAQVSIQLSSGSPIDWVMELREDDCNMGTPLVCRDPETLNFLATPDKVYYLIVEPGLGIDEGTFDLSFDFTPVVCAPIGGTDCDGTVKTRCVAGGQSEDRFQCADGCTAGECNGDTCANPIVVTASMSFSGEVAGYEGTLDFETQPSCSASGMVGLQTPGQEIVFSLPGLTVGQVVTVDALTNDQNDNAIFVTANCTDQEACLAAVDLGDTLNWTVQNAGNYFVVIDKTSSNVRPFNYSIDIQ